MAYETITARITAVQQQLGSEWFDVQTDDSRIKKLGTKRREIAVVAEQARRANVPVEIEFQARPSKNLNPHTNLPYMNYWLEGVKKAQQRAPEPGLGSTVDIPVVDAPTGRKTDPGDAWRMCLNKGGELAVMTLEYMDPNERSFENQKAIAIGWAHFFMTQGFPDDPADSSNGGSSFQAPESVRQSSHGAYSEPQFASVGGDDDIPF